MKNSGVISSTIQREGLGYSFLYIVIVTFLKGQIYKSKVVPLSAMEALGGRGGIAPTHSRPQHRTNI
jgi:hypothetical protein